LQSQPWWKIQLFVWEPVLFGTWDGVFTSCMINIFGVVLFLRTGWLVGNTGILLGIFLVSFVILVALVTVLSGIGVCERCSIGSGGVYSMISTVLGGKVGGTVGLLYIFGQCVAGAMYITGFAESISDLLRLQSTWAVRGISLAVLLGLLGINLAGVKWIIRLQLLLLFLLAVSTLDFVIGSFTHLDPGHGFVGYSEDLLRNNTFPDYSAGETFFTVFGVFFPAATGVMAGFNMSGDLRRPSVNIPIGSLAAIAISWFLYIVFVFLLGATCAREFLRYEFMIAEKVSLVGFLFLLGLYISSLASCMGGLYGAPRILQCIAQEKVIPILSFLAHGRGPNKTPVAAIFLTGLITMAFVFIGQVNILAPIVTINFMLTYSVVDYSYFSVTMSYNLQRCYRKVNQATSKTPSASRPLILDKSTNYGSNGTLLEFTRDMDQLFKEGHTQTTDHTKTPDKKRFMNLKNPRKPAKQTLQDSFQLDLKQNPEGPTADRTVDDQENRTVDTTADDPDYGGIDNAAKECGSTPDRVQGDRSTPDRVQGDRSTPDRVQGDRSTPDQVQEDRSTPDRVQEDRSTPDRVQEGKADHAASEDALDNQEEAPQCMCDEEEYVEGTGDQEQLFTEVHQPGAEERDGAGNVLIIRNLQYSSVFQVQEETGHQSRPEAEGPRGRDPESVRVLLQQAVQPLAVLHRGESSLDRVQGDRSTPDRVQGDRSTPDQVQEDRSTPDRVQEDRSTPDRVQEGKADHAASEDALDNQEEAPQCMCDEEEYVEGTGDQEQLFTEVHQPGAEERDDPGPKQKVPEVEIQSLSASFYSKLCNHWLSFIGAILTVVIMFIIQWIYALVNIGVAIVIYFYIGRVSPGLNPGAAANFSFFVWVRQQAATACRYRYVVTPTFGSVGMETTQLTEENEDFASRGRFHHSSVISRGHFINQFN
ncbi:PREDICTED: solute carrier family 12 member 8, partial [Nanorana parkeri]|uniref:solute carrier family 12 member 8 n=1 Tax=Nanorana parkeri TaxID=125878 RepID=UPI000854D376